MSKYMNVNVYYPNSSHYLLLKQIKQGSDVLECGCAIGYMTKVMNEQGCNVSVVEIDKDAINIAKQYAKDAYCGDLEEDGWKKHYANKTFDFIMFADVLEHLRNPLPVLKSAVPLLKDNGKILISIPNICHNDMIIRMFYNSWNYTGLGLLDDTHLRFWGRDELNMLVHDAGLNVESWESVLMPTQGTEQRMPFKVDRELLDFLRKRNRLSVGDQLRKEVIA